jgi:EGF-like domain
VRIQLNVRDHRLLTRYVLSFFVVVRHLGCNCKTGYVGPVCEFEDNGETSIDCDLTCKNHGICRKGAKDVSLLKKFGFDSNTSTAYNQDFQHCVCPRGYVGVQCEYQLDLCPGGVRACLNGGECVTVPNGSTVEYACDCSNAQTAQSRFAGEFCEMESTQFCTIGGGKSVSGVGINAFCTNRGTCRKFVQTFEE